MLDLTGALDQSIIDNRDLENLYYVGESEIHGRGLYARVDIDEGDYMGTYFGPEAAENGSHVLWIENDGGKWVGRDGINMLRYINHSREPHAVFYGFDLYAVRKIFADEEITIDYGEEPDPLWCE